MGNHLIRDEKDKREKEPDIERERTEDERQGFICSHTEDTGVV